MKKSRFLFTIFLAMLLALFLVQSVYAAGIFDSFNRILGGDNLKDFYENNSLWVDLVIYIFLFVYVSRFAFKKQEGLAKTGLTTVVGVALAIGATVFEGNSGMRIGDVGPFAMAIAMVIFAYVVYKLIHGMGLGGYQSAAFAYIGAYGFAMTVAQPLFVFIREKADAGNEVLGFVDSILSIFFVVAIIAVIMALVKKVPNMFGQGANSFGNIFSNATRNEEKESLIDKTLGKKETGEEKANENDLADAEKLLGSDIVEVEHIKNFLEQIEKVPLTPEYAARIAKEKGNALKIAVKSLLNYSERAKKEVEAAYKQNYAAIEQLTAELKRRSLVDARAERDKLPREQKDARAKAFDNVVTAQQRKNDAYIADIRNKGLQAAREEKQIEKLLAQVESSEQAVVNEVNKLVDALSRGDAHGATSAATLAIRALQASEVGVKEASQFIAVARKQIAGMIGELYTNQKSLNKERLEEHFEQANAKKI